MDMESTGTEARTELADDVRTATAFAKFDAEMSSLKDATDDLKANIRMTTAGSSVTPVSAGQNKDLGEEDKSVLDENEDDLKGDIDTRADVDDTPDMEKKADQLLTSMGAKKEKKAPKNQDSNSHHKNKRDLGEDDEDEDEDKQDDEGRDQDEDKDEDKDEDGDEDGDEDEHRRSHENDDDDDADRDDDDLSMLDSAESFIQTAKDDDALAQEDLSKDENDLMGRARLEANQWSDMEYADKMKHVEDYASAAADAEKASDSLDDIEEDIGEAAENVESHNVKSFVSKEDAREESEITAEEQKEREMEDKAKKKMLAEITSHSDGL